MKDDEIISDKKEISEIFNTFFINVVGNLNITLDHNILDNTAGNKDPILRIINRYKNHPSILAISENVM